MTPSRPTPAPSTFDRRVAARLEDRTAAVIAARDSARAAELAIAIARVHGATRRVAIADLIGESAPLEALVPPSDDPHGIADSFLYGVSLNKVARPIEGSGNVFLMPSGTEAVAIPGVYGNDRWKRLAAGFGQVGALLLIVARPDVEGFETLCRSVGAVIALDDAVPVIPDVPCLDLSQTPAAGVPLVSESRRRTPAGGARGVSTPTDSRVSDEAPPTSADDAIAEMQRTAERTAARARDNADLDGPARRSRQFAILAIIAAVVLIGLAMWPRVESWLAARRGAETAASDAGAATTDASPAVPTDSVPGAVSDAPGVAPTDSVTIAASTDSSGGAPRGTALTVVNPAAEAEAAAWGVFLVAANTASVAMSATDSRVRAIAPVATTPVPLPPTGSRWYRVIVGAGRDSSEAAALVQRLRDADVIGNESGSLLRVPYALRLAEGVPADSATARLDGWRRRGIDVYALTQADGRLTLYTGAFETPAQAAMLADSLRALGVPPTLAFRTGRSR